MPAKSKAQQALFGMVLAKKKGELKNASSEVKKITKGITAKAASDFAKKRER